MVGIKIKTFLKLKLNGLLENFQILTLGVLAAEKLQKRRWPKCCGTPCKYSFVSKWEVKDNKQIKINLVLKKEKFL